MKRNAFPDMLLVVVCLSMLSAPTSVGAYDLVLCDDVSSCVMWTSAGAHVTCDPVDERIEAERVTRGETSYCSRRLPDQVDDFRVEFTLSARYEDEFGVFFVMVSDDFGVVNAVDPGDPSHPQNYIALESWQEDSNPAGGSFNVFYRVNGGPIQTFADVGGFANDHAYACHIERVGSAAEVWITEVGETVALATFGPFDFAGTVDTFGLTSFESISPRDRAASGWQDDIWVYGGEFPSATTNATWGGVKALVR